MRRKQRTVALDVETTKVPRHNPWCEGSFLVSVGITDEQGWKRVWVFNHTEVENVNQRLCVDQIQAELNKAYRIVGHNLKFDLQWLMRLGIRYDHLKLYCTQVGEYLLERQRRQSYKLDDVARRYGLTPKIDRTKMFWESGYETDEIPLNILNPYLEQDCFTTLAIYQRQVKRIKDKRMENLIALQMELMGLLSEMEYNGALVDRSLCEKYITQFTDQLTGIELELKTLIGRDFNIGSGDQLSAVLFGGIIKSDGIEAYVTDRNLTIKEPYVFHYKDPNRDPVIKYKNRVVKELVVKTRKCVLEEQVTGIFKVPKGVKSLDKEGYWSTDKSTLSLLKGKTRDQKRILSLLRERSEVAKVLETFQGKSEGSGLINKIMLDGRVHPSFNQTVTATGRLSSSNPNGQNLPRKGTSPVKKVFLPRNDVILNADLAQLEWRVAAFLSQDPVAMKEIMDDVDYHRDNAIKFFGANPELDNDHPDFKPLRTAAKVFGFRLLYGGSAYGMYMDHTMPPYSLKRWEKIVQDYYKKYKRLSQWQAGLVRQVVKNGTLTNPTGREFFFPRFKKPNRRGEIYNTSQIKNYPVQSFATADITPLAMCLIKRRMVKLGLKSKIILQVHDSIVMDAKQEEVDVIARICIDVFRSLPKHIERFFGIKFNVPLDGDVEVGPNYGDLKKWKES